MGQRLALAAVLLSLALALALPLAALAEDHPGKAVYLKQCKSCHGADGKGVAAVAAKLKTEISDLTEPRSDRAAAIAEWTREIAEGEKKMPGYAKKLSPADLKAVTDYTIESFLTDAKAP